MTSPAITYVGFDSLELDDAEAAQVRSEIEQRSHGLRAHDATLRVHFTIHRADGSRAKYSAHLFLDHNGHNHTSDKHHAWDVREAIELAFNALETQLGREIPKHKGAPSVRKAVE